MKLLSLLFVSTAVSAFGVSPNPSVTKATTLKTDSIVKPAFRKQDAAVHSPLFRDPTLVRGGAVPGWAAYNKALDDSPLTAKAFTSLVGWALGDILAQVRMLMTSPSACHVGCAFGRCSSTILFSGSVWGGSL